MPRRHSSYIDPSCPLDWTSPLNRGVVADWTVLPNSGCRGSNRLLDNVRGGRNPHNGTLTNGPSWVGGANARLFGSLKFTAASSQLVNCGTSAQNQPTSTGAIELWLNQISTTGNQSPVGWSNFNTDRNGISIWASSGALRAEFCSASAVTSTAGGVVSIPAGWHHVVYTWDGVNIYAYVDGILLQTTGFVTTPTNNVNPIAIGGNTASGSYFDGYIGGVVISNQFWPTQIVRGRYLDSRRNSPLRFRWLEKQWWWSTQAAGGGVTVIPDTATLTTSGKVPTVLTPRTAIPGTLSLTLTEYAPTVLTPRVCIPGNAALTLTEYAPNVLTPRVSIPSKLSLTLTEYAPTVLATANQLVTPGVLSMALNTYAPTIVATGSLTPQRMLGTGRPPNV